MSGHLRIARRYPSGCRRFFASGTVGAALDGARPVFAHLLRAFAPPLPLLPCFSQCGRAGLRLAKKGRIPTWARITLFAGLCDLVSCIS